MNLKALVAEVKLDAPWPVIIQCLGVHFIIAPLFISCSGSQGGCRAR